MPTLRNIIPLVILFLVFLTPIHAQSPACTQQGLIERNTYYSDILGQTMYYSVYLPPCYDPETLYPVAYLMHGSNEDDGHWGRLGLQDILDGSIRKHELPPMIIAMPFGNVIANENQFDELSWNNIFLTEFMPAVESIYPIDKRRESRVIGGISRGGFWAFQIAFTHPELFSAVGGHSPFFDRYHAEPEDNPLDLALNAPDIDSLRIWMDRGGQDFAEPGITLMQERLDERGLNYEYVINAEGQHANSYWSQHVLEYLQFYAADWPIPEFVASEPLDIENGIDLLLPVVVFPSLQVTIDRQRLATVFNSGIDDKLLLTTDIAEYLQTHGVFLAEETQIVTPDVLHNMLWRDRTLYTLMPFNQLTSRYRVLNLVDSDGVELHPLDTDLMRYPFAFASDEPNFYPNRLTRLLMSGVTAITRDTRTAMDVNSVEWAGEAILPYVLRPDFFHTSNEVSMYPTCPQTDGVLLGGSWSFCSKPEHFGLLTDLDLDIVELSGNHNNDYGFDAYTETLNFYHEKGIFTVGGGERVDEARKPLILLHNDNTIAMVACNWIGPNYAWANDELSQPGAAYCDWEWLSATLPQLAEDNDLLIVTVQFQEFEQYTPVDAQRTFFRGLADLGADIVMGTQAHKPQTFEFYTTTSGNEAFIHYGLGNLFFDQGFWGNMRFFMDQLYIYEGRLLTVDLFTGIIDVLARPRAMTPEERENFLQFMFIQQNGF